MSDLSIATRGSALALAQARWVGERLAAAHRGLEVTYVEVTTSGDRDRVTSVTTLTEVGAFVRAVQETVLEGRADVAVHSCKDLPVGGPPDLVSVFPEREVPWDVLCGHSLDSLPHGARVGTGSPRRAAQLRALRPDVEVADIRGNVETRLAKVRSGEFDAVVLAEAGLRRLGLGDEVRHRFALAEMVPAPAQGALAVEIPSDDSRLDLIMAIDHADTRTAVEAERDLLAQTGAGCRSALGVYAKVNGRSMHLTGFVADEEGERHAHAKAPSPEAASRSLRAGLGL